MLKGTSAKLALCPREDEAGLGTSSLGFVKWNKESAGQWKVLGLLQKVFFVVFFFPPVEIRSC